MERVVSINLNGNSYQLDESAYDALRAYLGGAEAALADNPDKTEIIRDLEQAIADKCASYLSAHRSVVAGPDMAKIINEMGPVEGADGASGQSERPHGAEAPRKRLYRLAGDAKIAGVCSGVGAYFDIDANIIRLLFIIGFLFSGGALLLVYVAMMFLVPSAQTSAEWAAAYGAPFNAQEVIDRAKREYRSMAENAARGWRRDQWVWRWSIRDEPRSRGQRWEPPSAPVGYFTRVFAGLFAFIFSLITAALLIAFLVALFSLLNTGAVLGWTPPGDIPNWLAIVILCIAYAALSSPIRHLRRGSYAAASGLRYRHGAADELITLLAIIAGGVVAYQFVPEFRDWVQHLPDTFANFLALFE